MKSQELCVFVLLLAAGAAAGGRAPRGVSTAEQPDSPFIKKKAIYPVIEQQYETPAVMLVGTYNKLIRCVYGDLQTCETFHTFLSDVLSVLVVGEYVYAGVGGKIYRCDLNEMRSCQIYQRVPGDSVVSLAAASGYLYAGLEPSGIFRCTLNALNSCQLYKEFKQPVYALTHIEDYLYAGLWDGQIMRCALTSSECTLVYTTTKEITGFSNTGNSFTAVTYSDHKVWNCSRKADGSIESCVSVSLDYESPINTASFLGAWYIVENFRHIRTCEWVNGRVVCAPYGTFDIPTSIAFAYAAVHMRGRYTNEHTSTNCVWHRGTNCPQPVPYFNEEQRTQFDIHVKNGLLHNSTGSLIDTTDAHQGRAIFAMDRGGRILLSSLHKAGLQHTSSFFAGGPVAGAGELVVKTGVVEQLVSCSEHYRPSLELNAQVVHSLRALGYSRPLRVLPCDADLQERAASVSTCSLTRN